MSFLEIMEMRIRAKATLAAVPAHEHVAKIGIYLTQVGHAVS